MIANYALPSNNTQLMGIPGMIVAVILLDHLGAENLQVAQEGERERERERERE